MLPAVTGFSEEDRPDGPIINLSYYVFPALARLPLVAPELDWTGIAQTGLDLLKVTRFGPSRLPSDWISARNGDFKPADGFPPQFSYNSIRIPLYMIWAGIGDWEHYRDIYAWAAKRRGSLNVVDVKTGADAERFVENGYSSIGSLLLCAIDQAPLPSDFATPRDNDNYYPATLHLLSIAAARMKYPACLKN
jgi:endo-1,4-beta-D-glucanase Y